MNRKLIEYLPSIQKYLHEILKAGIDVRGFVVYGSIISEEMTKTSDIDIKIFVSRKGDIKKIEEIENKINKEMIDSKLTNLLHSILLVSPNTEHIENGILLYGKPIEIRANKEKLNEMSIITYNTTHLDKNKRVKLAIRLFGNELKRKIKNKTKVYKTDGIVSIYGGKTLRNAVLISAQDSEKIENVLKDLGVEYKKTSVYLTQFSEFIERTSK